MLQELDSLVLKLLDVHLRDVHDFAREILGWKFAAPVGHTVGGLSVPSRLH